MIPVFAAVFSPRLSSSAAPSTVTLSSILFNLFSPLHPASVRLAHCFISARGPSSLPPPRAPGRFAFLGSCSGLSGSYRRRRRHLPAGLPASRNRPARCGRRGARKRRGRTRESPGSRFSSASGCCQLPSSCSALDRAHLAGLGAKLRGVGCYFIFPPKEWSVGKE